MKTIVNLILVVKALLSYPLPYYAACELVEKELFQGKPETVFPSIWALDGELKVWKSDSMDFMTFEEKRILESFFFRESYIIILFAGLWSGLPRRNGCGDDPVCCRDSPLHSPNGVHRKLHRLHALIHLASHIPPHAQTPHHVKGILTNHFRALTRSWHTYGCAILLDGQKKWLSRQIPDPFLTDTSSHH